MISAIEKFLSVSSMIQLDTAASVKMDMKFIKASVLGKLITALATISTLKDVQVVGLAIPTILL